MRAPYAKYSLRVGDIVVAMDASFTSEGMLKAAPVRPWDLPALLVQRVARLRAISIDPQLLLYIVSSPAMADDLRRSQTGAYAPHISGRDISSYTFQMPDFREQQRIVEILNRVDAMQHAVATEASVLEPLRRGLLEDLLSGNHEIPVSYETLAEAASA